MTDRNSGAPLPKRALKRTPKTQHVFAAVFTVTLLGACAPMAKAATVLLSLVG